MAKVHVLDTAGGLTRVAYHIDVPAGANTVGPQGNCSVTVSPNRKSGSWSCP
jgi:hypothetical protein